MLLEVHFMKHRRYSATKRQFHSNQVSLVRKLGSCFFLKKGVLKTVVPLAQNEKRLAFLQISTNVKPLNLDFHKTMLRNAGFELVPF